MYTVHFVVRASTLLPLSGPLSQGAIAVLTKRIRQFPWFRNDQEFGHDF
jgi:hypothetical protein